MNPISGQKHSGLGGDLIRPLGAAEKPVSSEGRGTLAENCDAPWLDRIERMPGTPGDYTETDDSNREVRVVVPGDIALTYWPDHAAREVRIIQIAVVP